MRYPIFIVSKGRANLCITMRVLDMLGCDYRVIVEAQEIDAYAKRVRPERLVLLDPAYKRNYELCDELGLSKSTGPGPARNMAWDIAQSEGAAWHWVMDDNIHGFYRFHQNVKINIGDDVGFRVMEDFADRYENLALCGPCYEFFMPSRAGVPAFILNTRIYSCLLIRNDIPFRWRARYNEDTDLSLRVLKANWCTVQFCAFLQKKSPTQTFKGGCTDEFYHREGTLAKSEMLVRLHPDVARLSTNKFNSHSGNDGTRGTHYRYARVHHQVYYHGFKQPLKLKPGVTLNNGNDEYGMKIVLTEQSPTVWGSAPRNGEQFPAEQIELLPLPPLSADATTFEKQPDLFSDETT